MARSPIKTASESDVTPPAEETLDFDDDSLRGEEKRSREDIELIEMSMPFLELITTLYLNVF